MRDGLFGFLARHHRGFTVFVVLLLIVATVVAWQR